MAGSSFYNDPHSERGYPCPKNVFGYTDYRQVQQIELVFTQKRALQLEDKGVTGSFDSAHLKQIHHFLFRDIFPWAGQFRVVDLSKGNSTFGLAIHIEGALGEVLTKLKGEGFLRGLGEPAFCDRAAFYLGEINAIHPFREGNGRTQREFIRQLALSAGHTIDWYGFNQQQMTDASIASHLRGDYSGLSRILRAALVRS